MCVGGCFLSHLPVRAEVQRPQVCLMISQVVLPDLYVGVAQSAKTTLFNQTLLPAHFMWSKVGQKCTDLLWDVRLNS